MEQLKHDHELYDQCVCVLLLLFFFIYINKK